MSNDDNKPARFMAHVIKKLGMRDPAAEHAKLVEQIELQRQQREAEDTRLLSKLTPFNTPRVVTAAKAAIEQWAASLPPHRLLQPFYLEEIRIAVAHTLAAQGKKNTRLAPNTIGRAMWQLGFTKHRAHGSTRPQTRFWLHPSANGKSIK